MGKSLKKKVLNGVRKVTSETNNYLLELTQPEAEAILRRSQLAIIPNGSVEQHGPHLPCGTDHYCIMAIARKVASGLDGLLLPFSHTGVTPFHESFAGTLTLRQETYVNLLLDTAVSVINHGVQKILFVNWHEGNTTSINYAASQLQKEYGVTCVVAQACYIAEQLYKGEADLTHAGALEVLPVMAYRPDLLKLERATNPSPYEAAKEVDALRRSKSVYPILKDIRQIAPTGWYGDLDIVSKEKAAELVERVSAEIITAAQQIFERMQ
ncbi:creatininase family protein [Desulfitobacterium chlororespirans]|uniref:Creatinine amidohydrolase n=1 Tax=Desulfitobacterium chlororespirans DSM 11544 TaxID=1121395 RepID=A0A1M7SED2_9FIRM|nr:creatininase family protein [Desulfitobacterium chlororespirans]SHN56866.1 creatinine amidohydrolase [Desulfitobacterium chlororespirans DSM 11544]